MQAPEPGTNVWMQPRMREEDTCFRLRPSAHRLTTVHLTPTLPKLALGDGACLELRRVGGIRDGKNFFTSANPYGGLLMQVVVF